tara:strand:+ start:38 stop:1168 length:1131 start_codon:yes stop_codon:yes gene_type:complete
MPGFEWINKLEEKAVKKVFLEGGVLMAHGFEKVRKKFYVRSFESKAKNYFNSKNCLAVTSGTAAIKIGLKALNIKPGDEVITQSFNFIATIEAILDCGATPIIANIDETLNIDVKELKKLINKKTKAIIPVHMLGAACNMKEIIRISKIYKVPILEDNCEAVGGKYNNKYLGTLGDIGVFSFDHGKILTTGEGGMILTNKKKYDDYCRQYHDHGHENNKNFPRGRDTRKIFGFNYRMTELQGTIGIVQLKKLKKMITENKKKYKILEKILSKKFKLRKLEKNSSGIFDTFILFQENKKKREKIIKMLTKLGFGTKNLPDAMEWHCSFFWSHALTKHQVKRSKKSFNILEKSIAIPILKNKKKNQYIKLGENLINLA